MRSVQDRLEDALEAIERVERSAEDGKTAFFKDEYRQVWMIHHIQIIGEAVRAVSDQLVKLSPQYPWAKVVGMRNILVHDYFGIDLDEI